MKKRFRIAPSPKHRKRPHIRSAVRPAIMAGTTIEVIIITCCVNLTNESSGLKAHRMLAPANARYAKRQMMWKGKVSLPRRERLPMAKTTEIAAIAGQNSLLIRPGSDALSSVLAGEEAKSINGPTIVGEEQAKTGIIVNLSSTGVEDLVRPVWNECIGGLDILDLYRLWP